MAVQKNQTVKRDYYITVQQSGKVMQSFTVKAESIRDSLKQAYNKLCGWQGVPVEDLDNN